MPRRFYTPRLSDADRRPFELHESIQWANVREAALNAFDVGDAYRYHDGRTTHECGDLAELARVTRVERRRMGIRWPEDR